jgi:hypothetical protein
MIPCYISAVASLNAAALSSSKPKFFYGWYIVGTGFLTNIASAFALARTLSSFLKP